MADARPDGPASSRAGEQTAPSAEVQTCLHAAAASGPASPFIELTRGSPADDGIRREEFNGTYGYVAADGTLVTDPATLLRIRSLRIPPSWRQVWIAAQPTDHLQAVGVDHGGKQQYLYHRAWVEHEARLMFDRALELGASLASARAAVDADLRSAGPTKRRALAAAFRMLDTASLRVGSERYAQEHGSFGLSSLLSRHASVSRNVVRLSFPAKSHHAWSSMIEDPALVHVVRSLKLRGPDEVLLAYFDRDRWHPVHAEQINEYVRDRTGGDFSAKDFRTLHGTVAAALSLQATGIVTTSAQRSHAIAESIRAASNVLENTPAVARQSYVDPRLLDRFTAEGRFVVGPAAKAEGRLKQLLSISEVPSA